ncbi:chemotaxis protein CheB [Rugamonas apoptosis]|uniref:PAS domain-containing protein n=1 Tax=Rugamonas apoptosis TaxID=2758570 RepID=A0A7W2IM91_9BURK|nr:chemotaxis protein CheB [Rugamonas apoptosis]MBA5689281.1 PAS domain-containing protein [Rugamonas apoptosis]
MTKHAPALSPASSGPAPADEAVPVVAIGASAGGLEPICEFLASVPSHSGLAYVVIQHLDPQHKGILPELLQRVTPMPVREITDRMPVEADHVYVIPPNHDLGIAGDALTLRPPAAPRGLRLPIDSFFAALADACGERAIGIVLSGMGGDGTRGLQAIKVQGGMTLAQTPASAKFDPMPQSAIDAGAADIVAPPGDMPALILGHWRRPAFALDADGHGQRDVMGELYQLLQQQVGADFSQYKLNTMLRRIERRMKLRQCATMDLYVDCLRDNPQEVELLFKELLIGVTQFFRDPKVWDYLAQTALPELLAAHPKGLALKAWVPACSTGEEAYSLAIVFSEVLERLAPTACYTLQIFATDLDPDAIGRGRLGHFGRGIEADVSPQRLQRHFVADEQGYRIRKELRNAIIFAQQNIISDPPFSKLDILCCRNLLIYFDVKLQEQLIPLFHYALKRDGLLILGSADTPGRFTDLFAPVPGSGRIYRRLDGADQRVTHYFPTRASNLAPPPASETRTPSMSGNLQHQVEQHLLRKHTPAAALLNPQGDILYIHGRTGAFLEPAAGKANWNIHAMAREGLRFELADLIARAARGGGIIAVRGLVLKERDTPPLGVDLTAEALPDGAPMAGMILVTFATAALAPPRRRSRSSNPRVQELEQLLMQARQDIQTVRDEMQTSREELKSANEELQSTNEELQSTNEELTTSKEEMQSLNEELYTVNAELQSKVDDLSMVNGDMKNLLNSTDIATIFLDNELCIRRFTNQATQIYKLIPSDLNRPLGDIVNDLDYPDLQQDAREVLRTLVFSERQVPTSGGRWYTVRIMPYRTVDNVIDGVVVTFINITEAKQLEARLRAMQGGADIA